MARNFGSIGGAEAAKEILKELLDVTNQLRDAGEEAGRAAGEGYEDGAEETREIIKKSEKELLADLDRFRKNFEKAIARFPKAIKNAVGGFNFNELYNMAGRLKTNFDYIEDTIEELSALGVNVDNASWMQSMAKQAEQLVGSLDYLRDATGSATSAADSHSNAIERQAHVTEHAARSQQRLNKAMREQPKSGGNKMSADNSTDALMKGTNINRLLKQLNVSKEDAEQVLTKFGSLANMIAQQSRNNIVNDEIDLDIMDNIDGTMKQIADMIMSMWSERHDKEVEGLKEFYEYMRGKMIGYTDSDVAEFGDAWADIKKKFGTGKYKVLDKDARGVNDSWEEIVDMFGHLLEDPDDITPQGQLKQVLELLQKARDGRKGNKKTYEKLPESYFDDIVVSIGDDTAIIEQNAEKMIRAALDVAEKAKGISGGKQGQKNKAAEKIDIMQREVNSALERLRNASDNKTALVDLTGVNQVEDLEAAVRSMAEKVVGSELKVDSVVVQDDIARITLYNEQLGVTASQMWQLKESTEDAAKAQMELISETQKHSPRAAQKYSDAQQKQIENDNKWLIAQMSRLNTMERQYKYSGKKIDGSSLVGELDETSMEQGIDGTIDNLASHIKSRIAESMDGVLTDQTKNAILNDLRILDNEIKTEQYKQHASTTMSPTEVSEARKQFEYTLDALEAKAHKNNVFDQMSASFTQLRDRLTNESVADYVKDGTDVGKFVDSLRTAKSELNAAIAEESLAKKEEQNYKNLLNLQERLYESKKRTAEIYAKGEGNTSESMKAERVTAELQQQYDASMQLLQNDQHRNAALERQAQLEQELNTLISERLSKSFMNVASSAQGLADNSFIDKSSGIYQQTVAAFQQYTSKVASLGGAQNASNWSAEEYAEVEALAKAYLELAGSFETAAAKQQEYFRGKQEYKSGDSTHSVVPYGEQQRVLTEQEQAYQKLKERADEFAQSSGASGAIVTKFVQDANGISRLDFSVLEKGTMTMQKFSMEMGSLNQNKTFLTGLDASSFTASMNAAYKQMESISGLMQTIRGHNISVDAGGLSQLVAVQSQLEAELAKGSSADESVVARLTREAKLCQSEVERLLKQMHQMDGAIRTGQATGLGKIDTNGDIYEQLITKAQEFASTQGNVALELGKFDQVTNTLNASLVGANGTVERFKVSMYGLGGECAAQRTGVTKLTTSWDTFKMTLAQAGKRLMTALVGYNVFFKAVSEVRKGIGYVKEIDLALTELKKVTDETEESYRKFLDTASNTAGKIGSTVSDFTEATSNFARLGYSMEESAQMAETAIVYKNVADGLDTVDAATESIISTMKAFGIESNDTMGIIDRFNEVGFNMPKPHSNMWLSR